MITREMLLVEDNIAYYGFVCLFYHFFIFRNVNIMTDGLISGLCLGGAIWAHTSPVIFLTFLLYMPILFFVDKCFLKKTIVMFCACIIVYFSIYVQSNPSGLFVASWANIVDSPLIVYLKMSLGMVSNIDFSQHDSLGNYSTLEWSHVFMKGFLDMNGVIEIRGVSLNFFSFLSFFSVLIFIFFQSTLPLTKRILKNHILIVISLISLGIVFFYEPQTSERWDFFLLLVFVIGIRVFSNNNQIKNKFLLYFFCGIQSFIMLLAAHNLYKNNEGINDVISVKKFINIIERTAEQENIVFPARLYILNPYILSMNKGKESWIYFFDEKNNLFSQAPFSLVSSGKLKMKDLNRGDFFIRSHIVPGQGVCKRNPNLFPEIERSFLDYCRQQIEVKDK